jgi:hypothetical protein
MPASCILQTEIWFRLDACQQVTFMDALIIPDGAAHGFVNVTDSPAREYILIAPALDAVAFFTELAETMRHGLPDRTVCAFSGPNGMSNSSGRR